MNLELKTFCAWAEINLCCCLSCAISELVSRSETIEVAGLVNAGGTGVDAEGVVDGIGGR